MVGAVTGVAAMPHVGIVTGVRRMVGRHGGVVVTSVALVTRGRGSVVVPRVVVGSAVVDGLTCVSVVRGFVAGVVVGRGAGVVVCGVRVGRRRHGSGGIRSPGVGVRGVVVPSMIVRGVGAVAVVVVVSVRIGHEVLLIEGTIPLYPLGV
jgi:hypothetical protein